jgi:diadenosine tetraphosphatase ApaH/serine/threonine PP2A family protein phosphatase
MMDAVITDIHGNLEALDAVLDVIRQLDATRIICLGDLVCYGPDSLECLRRSATWDIVIAGDWDCAMIEHDPTQWNPTINEHIEWVRDQIHSAFDSATLLDTLRSFRRSFVENGCSFVHGSPGDLREWVFPEDVYDHKKLNRIAELFDDACICGHSHIQGVFRRKNDSEWDFIQPNVGESYELKQNQKTIITAGSVGQPRDDDPRASFLTIDGRFVTFHRVAYNVMTTVAKIRAIPEIDNMHGERLLIGR